MNKAFDFLQQFTETRRSKRKAEYKREELAEGINKYFTLNLVPQHYGINPSFSDYQCRLEIARLEAFRQLKITNQAKDDEGLPLGPLSALEVREDAFLSFYFANSTFFEQEDLINEEQLVNLLAAMKDSSDIKSRNKIMEKQIQSRHAQQHRSEAAPAVDLFRKTSTPCPVCHFNPYSIDYLKLHLFHFHKMTEADAQASAAGSIQKDRSKTPRRRSQRREMIKKVFMNRPFQPTPLGQ